LDVNREIAAALNGSSGPVFLGPRLEFGYLAFHLPSPVHYPVYWQPGTSFDRGELPALLRSWQQQRFSTVLLYKDDHTYLPMSMLDALSTSFLLDDRFPHISVYRRRPGF
ncbi:MAG: hypothetical protein INR62_11455, partial [Rhodospirillales bacterium]|nr:hypothetical protein [Acetobacter sp.]